MTNQSKVADERAAIVAWLRREMYWSGGEDITMAYIASCIERGDHLRGEQ